MVWVETFDNLTTYQSHNLVQHITTLQSYMFVVQYARIIQKLGFPAKFKVLLF